MKRATGAFLPARAEDPRLGGRSGAGPGADGGGKYRATVGSSMSRIATGTGDEGETSLFGGDRVSKTHPAVEAYGTVDELNGVLGIAHAAADAELAGWIERVQAELFAIGAELATPGGGGTRIRSEHVDRLEAELDELEGRMPELKTFILPSGTELAARLHNARSVCRRAERRVIALHESEAGPVREEVRVYLNRLSDLLFLESRHVLLEEGAEVPMDFTPFREDDG